MEPVRVRVVFDAAGQPQLRRGADSIREISTRIRDLAIVQGQAGRALRAMEADMNRYSQMLHRTTSQGLMFFNSAFERTFSMFTRLAQISFFKLVAELGVVGYSLRNLGRQFLNINEQFAGLEITMRSMFGSVRAARAVRDELAKITIASPLPFKDLADAVRAAAAMPSLAPRFATQIASNDLSNEKGFLRQYVQLLEQLTTFRPDKLTTDAVFALREAISGELRSLVRRFEFPAALLVQSSGKPLDYLKTRPDAMFSALKGALDRLITPEAIRQIVRQPSKLKENIIEQAVQIPLLQVGRAGEKAGERSLYQRILDVGQNILNRFGEFSNVERGAFGPISRTMGQSLSGLFDKFTSKLDRGIDRLFSAAGSGRFDILGSSRIERGYDIIQRTIEYVANNFDKFTAKLKSVYDTLAPIFKFVTDWMLRFASLLKKAFDFSPWAGIATLGLIRKIPAIGGRLGGRVENAFIRDTTALRSAIIAPSATRSAGLGTMLYPGVQQFANVYTGRYVYSQPGVGFLRAPTPAGLPVARQLFGAARAGGAGWFGSVGGAVAGGLASMIPGMSVGGMSAAATGVAAIAGGAAAFVGPILAAVAASYMIFKVIDVVADHLEKRRQKTIDDQLKKIGLDRSGREAQQYGGEAEASFVRRFSQFIKDVNERPELSAYRAGARFQTMSVQGVPYIGAASQSVVQTGPPDRFGNFIGPTASMRKVVDNLNLQTRTQTMDLAGVVELRSNVLGDIQRLIKARSAGGEFVPQTLASVQQELDNGTRIPMEIKTSGSADLIIAALQKFYQSTTTQVVEIIQQQEQAVSGAVSFGTPFQDSERGQLDRWKETLQDLQSMEGFIQSSTRFDPIRENLKAVDISPSFRQIIDESEKAFDAFQETHDPYRRIVDILNSDRERLVKLVALGRQITDLDQPVDETGVPLVEVATNEQAARITEIINGYRQLMAKRVTDSLGRTTEMMEKVITESDGTKRVQLIPFDQYAEELRADLVKRSPQVQAALRLKTDSVLNSSLAQNAATASLIIPRLLSNLGNATSSVTDTAIKQIEELIVTVRNSQEVALPKDSPFIARFNQVVASLRSAPTIEDAVTPFDKATVERSRVLAFRTASEQFASIYDDLSKTMSEADAASFKEKTTDIHSWLVQFSRFLSSLDDKLREVVQTMSNARLDKSFEAFLSGSLRTDTGTGAEQLGLAQQAMSRRFGAMFPPDTFGFLSGPGAGKGYQGEFSRESGMIGVLGQIASRLQAEIAGNVGSDIVSSAKRAFDQQELDGINEALSRFRDAISVSTEELRRNREAESLQALRSLDILGSSGLGVRQSDEAIREMSRRYGVSLNREDLGFLNVDPNSPTETGELLRQSGWFDTMKRRIIPQIEAQISSITAQLQNATGDRKNELEQALEQANSNLRDFSKEVERLGLSFRNTEEQFRSARLAKALDAALDPSLQGGSPYGPAQIQDAVDQLMRRYGIKASPSDFAYLSLPNENGRSGNRTFGREKGAAEFIRMSAIPQAQQKVRDAEGVTTAARGALVEKATNDLREFERIYNQLLLEMTKGSKDNSFSNLEKALNALREMTSPELGYKLGRKGSVDPRVQFQTGMYAQTDPRLGALMKEFDMLTGGRKTLSILPGFEKALQIDTRGFEAVTGQLKRQVAFQQQFAHTAKELEGMADSGMFDQEVTSKLLDQAAAWNKLADEAERTAESITGRGGVLMSMTEGFGGVVSQWTATAQNWTNVGQSIAESLSSTLSDALLEIAKNAKTAGEAFRDFGAAFTETAARIAMNKTIESILGYAFSGIGGAFTSSKPVTGGGITVTGATGNTMTSTIKTPPPMSLKPYATGGLLPGQPTGQDNMLIMAGSGEFIVPANVVKRYGIQHFQRYLTGSLPVNSYAMGGMVSSGGSSGWSGGGSSTINVPITVTVNSDGQTQSSGSDSEDRGRALARSLQAAVREQLMVEQRQGGLLYRGARK